MTLNSSTMKIFFYYFPSKSLQLVKSFFFVLFLLRKCLAQHMRRGTSYGTFLLTSSLSYKVRRKEPEVSSKTPIQMII